MRRTVFPSMCDPFEVFDGHVDIGPCASGPLDVVRARLWDLIAETPHLVWLLLTKRPENVLRMVPCDWYGEADRAVADNNPAPLMRHFPRNVLIGTTVEDQRRADERMPHLLRIPARRFLSVEPQLEAMDLTRWLSSDREWVDTGRLTPRVNWLIAGGERCAGARPYDLAWPRALRDQCRATGVPFFFKQAGDNTVGYSELRAKSPLEDIPADLRIREVPSW